MWDREEEAVSLANAFTETCTAVHYLNLLSGSGFFAAFEWKMG
jgi:hypothetical protein